MRYVFILLFSIIGSNTYAQTEPPETWQLTFEDIGEGQINNISQLSNGDLIVAGHIYASAGAPSDAWLCRLDREGRVIWSKTLGSTKRDNIGALKIGADDSIYIAGMRDSIFNSVGLRSNGFVARFSPNGEKVWENIFSEPNAWLNMDYLSLLEDGNIFAGGTVARHEETNDRRLFVSIVKPDGDILNTDIPRGFAESEFIDRDIQDDDGNVIATEKIRIAKIDTEEVSQTWQTDADKLVINTKQYGIFGSNEMQGCFVQILTPPYAIEECTKTAAPRPVTFSTPRNDKSFLPYTGSPAINKHAEDGAIIFSTPFIDIANGGFRSVIEANAGATLAAGYTLTEDKVTRDGWDGLLVKLDAAGGIVWTRHFGGQKRDEFSSILELEDGSIIVAGYTGSQGAVQWSPWLMRLTPEGELTGDALAELEDFQE